MTAVTKANTTKHAASSFDMPDYGIPKIGLPNMEMPAAFREIAGKGVAHAKDTHAQAKVASDQAVDLLQNTYLTAAKGAAQYNLKLIEFARINTRLAFDGGQELLGVKSPSEFFERSTAQMRKQFDIISAQNRELCALAQEVATVAAEPIKTGVSKALNKAI
jgi:phasin